MIEYISILLMILAGMFNSSMDVLKHKWSISIFKDWNNQNWIDPTISWHTKWNIDQKLFGKQVWLVDKLMSTVLVWVTDMWHFVKMLMLVCISFAIIFYSPIYSILVDAIIFYFAFTGTFELFYSKIFVKKS